MAGVTNIAPVNPAAANQETDTAYVADTLRSGGITVDAILPSPYLNKKDYQYATVLAALALFLVNNNFNVMDGSPSEAPYTGSYPSAITALAAEFAQAFILANNASFTVIPTAPTSSFGANNTNLATMAALFAATFRTPANQRVEFGTTDGGTSVVFATAFSGPPTVVLTGIGTQIYSLGSTPTATGFTIDISSEFSVCWIAIGPA